MTKPLILLIFPHFVKANITQIVPLVKISVQHFNDIFIIL